MVNQLVELVLFKDLFRMHYKSIQRCGGKLMNVSSAATLIHLQSAKKFFDKCESESRDLGLELPSLTCRSGSRIVVLRQTGNASAKYYYAFLYVKVFQECCAALKKRYPQEDLTSASAVEDALL
ncbi:unnamed protein product [Clavelina lepadiformis]|uniref:Uncharacterized protein n=1 Tax=Clavelina lepadiformis TaxID=159417 RepID=A0ABP0FDP3_CLALP